MSEIFRKASKISLWSLIVLAHVCCSKAPLKDPAADDLSDLSIDPDQPAIPADDSSQTSKNSAPVAKADAVSGEQNNKVVDYVPPTPRIEDLEADRPAAEPAPVEPEAPVEQSATESGASLSRFGSGPQVRYIKAVELNVREKPDRYSKIVGVLKGGDKVRVQVKGGWAKLDEGRWIRSRWLVKRKPAGAFSRGIDEGESQSVKQNTSKKRGSKSKRTKRVKSS
jgi:hypothetical protein